MYYKNSAVRRKLFAPCPFANTAYVQPEIARRANIRHEIRATFEHAALWKLKGMYG